jgi:dihydrofolate reductase
MTKPTITIIVAALKPQWGIGYKGKMPWRLKQEIKYFKQVTSHTPDPSKTNAVIMGRKTWDSIPPRFRPLKDRVNVVLSRSFKPEKVDSQTYHADSLESGLQLLTHEPIHRIFIIGGAELYNQVINDARVTNLLITEINADEPVEMDTFLQFNLDENWTKRPKQDLQQFIDNDEVSIPDDIKEGIFTYNYTLWTRK